MGPEMPSGRGDGSPGRSHRLVWPWAARGLVVVVAIGLLAAVALACGAPSGGTGSDPSGAPQEITILGSWEESELATLRDVVAPFEERTGHRVTFVISRDLKGEVAARLVSGDRPDIAGMPGPGYLVELAKAGELIDLGAVIDLGSYKRQTAPAFIHLGTVDSRLVGVFLKGTIKGLLWYEPDVFRSGPIAQWSRLQHEAMTAMPGVQPWCIGLESGEASGWPGTDWIEDFVLRQSGPQVYDDWVGGRIRWSSPEIQWAFQSYGTVVGERDVAGGVQGALETHFSRAGDGLFTDPPQCLFIHGATFMATFLDQAVEDHGGRYDFMPFPHIDPRWNDALIGAGDLVVLLRDTRGGRALIEYLMSTEAQSILVAAGGALSGNLLLTDYPDALLQRQAELLQRAKFFRFDASDAMPEPMSRAFWQAVLDFTADQSKLDQILARLDEVQDEAYR